MKRAALIVGALVVFNLSSIDQSFADWPGRPGGFGGVSYTPLPPPSYNPGPGYGPRPGNGFGGVSYTPAPPPPSNQPGGHGGVSYTPLPPPPGQGHGEPGPGNHGGGWGPGGNPNNPGHGGPGGPKWQRHPVLPPPHNFSPDEYAAAQLAAESVYTLNCEQTAEILRNMSNRILDRASWVANNGHAVGGHGPVNEPPGIWRQRMRNPAFWNKVWEYLAEAFKSCDMTCFDDGVAVGQISGTGYCQASVSVGGLNAPGFLSQPPLPVCQTEIYTGCQQGYRDAAQTFSGCSTYTQGQYEQVFDESISQDCHIDSGS